MFKTCVYSAGMDGVAYYRIPSLICTKRGTLIAAADARLESVLDNPNKVDKVVRLSFDNGDTWTRAQTVAGYPGRGIDGAAAIDPAMVEDRTTNTVWMFFTHTPGGIGLFSAESGTGFDREGRKLLYDESKAEYHLNADGSVADTNGQITSFKADKNGDVFRDGSRIGNIYLKNGPLLERRTSFLQAVKSQDDGMAWSEPIDINAQVKADWMRSLGTGCGTGIQLRNSPYKGRLLMPAYFTNEGNFMSCCVIYSDDDGATWKRGTSPNDGRIFNGKRLDSRTLDMEKAQLTEAQAVELANGDVALYMRNHAGLQSTAVSVSRDGGITWGEVHFDDALVNPVCQASVIRYPGEGDILLWCNPADERERIRGTLRVSPDAGKSWTAVKTVEESFFAYCCLAVLKNGEIGLLYESDEYRKIEFIRMEVPFDDIQP